jgi:uncharacterized protein YecA (UPF0149 family)
MEKHINMSDRNKVHKIIKEIDESSNNELIFALDFLSEDYEKTKMAIINLTKYLDGVETVYNKVLKEVNKRKGVK